MRSAPPDQPSEVEDDTGSSLPLEFLPTSSTDESMQASSQMSLSPLSPVADRPSDSETNEQEQRSDSQTIATIQQASASDPVHVLLPQASQCGIAVYIPDLPVGVFDDERLEPKISQRLTTQHVVKVRCYSRLGIGVVYVNTNEDKRRLLHEMKTMELDSSAAMKVSFTDSLELVSYVVVESKHSEDPPSIAEVSQCWMQQYRSSTPVRCELLADDFPNVFLVVMNSLDELLQCTSTKQFSINGRKATVYFQAHCFFFEDLPPETRRCDLRYALSEQLNDQADLSRSVYIQCNVERATAVILASDEARVLSICKTISLNGQRIEKKTRLTRRLAIRKNSQDLPVARVHDHEVPVGIGKIKKPAPKNNVDVKDAPQPRMNSHKQDEIDAHNWYETEMCCHESDITPFMADPQHRIFRLAWNPEAFLEQFRRIATDAGNRSRNERQPREKANNDTRHRLRMTVMLNTVEAVRKGLYRVDGKVVQLDSRQLKTIVYDHRSKMQDETTEPLSSAASPPYASTTIQVVNEDCLIAYQNLAAQGCQPVLLNMANAYAPGGGYRRGDGAQEETVFRRSNYYRSLDADFDDDQSAARFRWNERCEREPLAPHQCMYPMDEFGGIYTSGLTVFRQPEDTGYAFMKEPLLDVCAIAVAAYRNPELDKNNKLVDKYSINTRQKIENLFAIAHHQRRDSLVLSALGCGAFHNPPEHVADIFRSVIEQYAGFFKTIVFAIIDDHNTGQQLNQHGNYRPFKTLLDGRTVKPVQRPTANTMIGPWRILKLTSENEMTLREVRILHQQPCSYGGKCSRLQLKDHCRKYSHPPLCLFAGSETTPCRKQDDQQHMLWFRHDAALSPADLAPSDKPQYVQWCHYGGQCDNLDTAHLLAYRHVPLCEEGLQCAHWNRQANEHCEKYRHCRPMCHDAHFCNRFHDEKHMAEENHPFPPPCPLTPFQCPQYTALSESSHISSLPDDVQNHCLQYSHVCRFGRRCFQTSELHWESTIHVARTVCPYGINASACTTKII